MAQPWPLAEIRAAAQPWCPELQVCVLEEIDSSNSELMRRARSGDATPTLLVAERQTAGRGRLGRSWLTGSADALTFSLGLPLKPVDWSGFSLAVGVALAETIDPQAAGAAGPRLSIKWPNDLWLAERKLAGILIETATLTAERDAARYTVIGVGLNLSRPSAPSLATPPAWLSELEPELGAPQWLLRLTGPLMQAVRSFESLGFTSFRERFLARDALSGREVRLSSGVTGTACGVTETGALLVHTAAGMEQVTSSEISVRPC